MDSKSPLTLFRIIGTLLGLLILQSVTAQYKPGYNKIDKQVEVLLSKMTLSEKIGQLSQYVGGSLLTGTASTKLNDSLMSKGLVGSVLNITGVNNLRQLQQKALAASRLKIPVIFAYDVIHGYKTIFPVPLAESCSWDLNAIKNSAKIAAIEASSAGLNWTFAPMVDIARDPRWGRVVEGAGEDTYLGSLIAKARVSGFQWNIGHNNSVIACVKHFAAYGLPQGGKDYGPVDISERTLQEIYLPPFKAAVDAGVGTLMTSFNEINGIPSTTNSYLLKDILKKKWQFKGFVVSDWNAVKQLTSQGTAANEKQAAELAFNAGTDMDMTDGYYNKYLQQLVLEKRVKIEEINNSVRRILKIKYELGLFADPYKYFNYSREKENSLTPEFLSAARDIGKRSIVLLKNEQGTLPLSTSHKTIALIGPFGKNKIDLLGSWCALGDSNNVVSLFEGLNNKLGHNGKVLYSFGCSITGTDTSGFKDAIETAKKSDVVLLTLGEEALMSGESNSRASLDLPGVQNELAKALVATGKPIVVILMNGRPLAINWIANNVSAILETWFLGIQAGNAISDVLFGDYNPSGKLTMTFPASVGQVPIFYNHKNSGRPGDMEHMYTNRYVDIPSDPLFHFGYGLSYTTFSYSAPRLISKVFTPLHPLKVQVTIKNSGGYDGEEVVQLYIRDLVASVTRPVKELKGFYKVFLKAGESKEIDFMLNASDISFIGQDMRYRTEPGDFEIMVGTSSSRYQSIRATFKRK